MSDEHTIVLSAFCDGEPVDPDAFATALATPSGRAALVDFARLRAELVHTLDPLPTGLDTLRSDDHRRVFSGRLSFAAAVLLFALLTGLGIVKSWLIPAEGPPRPDFTLRFEPGVDWQQKP